MWSKQRIEQVQPAKRNQAQGLTNMGAFLMGTAILLTGLSIIGFLIIIALIVFGAMDNLVRMFRKQEVLPPPDKAVERVYGQQYLDRAVSKD